MPDFDSLYNQLATNPSIKNGIVNPIFVDREVGVNPYATQADPLYAKYLDQSKLNQFGNALERGVVKFALSIPENAGYMFDMANSNKDFDNSVSAWARNLKEDVDREFPEYSKYFEDGFNPGSYNWWMRNGDSIVESIGYMVPGLLVGKTVGTFAKLMGAAANTARMAGAVGAAVASNYAEGMQMAGSRYREMLESGVSKEIAAEQASSIVNQNRWNILLQIPESYMLLRGLGGTRSFASLGFKNSMKDIGKQFVMEGFEEWNQGFIEEDNVREGKIRAGLLVDDGSTKLDRILKYGASDDALTQAFIGGIGGGAMQGGSDVLANLDPKYKEQKQKALAQIAANHGETVKMFEDLAKIQTAKENSVNDEVQFKHLARTQALEIALKNAKQGTFSQFLKTFDAVSNMSQEEAEQKGLTEAVKMAAEIRPALLKIEQKYGSLESKHSNISKDFIVDVAKQAFLADSHKKAADEYSEKIDTAYKTVRDVLTKQANKAQNSYIATQGVLAQFESLLKDNKDSEFFKYGVEEATKARDRAVKQVEEADNFGKLTDKDWKDKNTSLPMLDDDIKSDMELELINSIKADFHSKEYEKYADPKKIKTILEEQAKEEEIKVKNEEEAAYNEILKPVKTLIDKAKSTAVFEEGEKVKTKSELQASFDVLKNSKGFKQASKTTQTKLEQEYLSAIKAIDRAKDKTEIKSEEVKKDNRKARIAIIDKQIEKLKKLIKTQHLNKYKNRAKLAEVNESIKKLQDEKELLNSYIAATGNTSPEVREEVVIKSVIQEVEYSEVKTNEEYFNSFIKRFIKSLKVLDTNGLTELFETVKADLTKSIQQLNQIKYDSLNGIQTTKQEEDLVKMIIANNTAKLAAIEEEFVLREIVEENNETIILEENTQTGRTLIKQKEVEQAFKSVAVDDISEDGRVITIRGKKYYNQYSDGISGAINRNKNGDIVSISLSNEQGKTVTFTQSKLVDEIAFALLSTEVLIKRDISESVVIASEVEEQIDEFKIASERKTQSIKEKIEFLEKDLYELEQIIWYLDIALAQEYDMLVAEGIDTKESKELLRTSAQYSQRESAKEIVKIIKNKKEKLSEELKKPAIVKPLKNESTKITRKPAVESTETTSEQTNKGKNTFVKEIPFEERGVSVADLLYDIIKEEEEAKSKEKEIAETIIVPIIETIETTVTAEEETTFIPSDKDLQENAKEANPEFDGEVVTRKKDNIQTGGYQGRPYTKTTEGDQIFYEDIVDENGNPVINTPNDPRLNDYTFFKPKEELEIVIDEDEAKRLGIEIKEENLYKIPFGIRKPGSPITMWVHTFSAPPGIGIDQRIKDLIAEKEDLQKVEQDKLVSLRNFLWSKLQNGGVVPASVKDKTTGYALFTEARNTIDQVGIDGKVADDIEFLYVQDDLLKPIGESENRVNLQGRRDKSGKLMFPTGSTLIGVPSMTVDRLTGKNLLEPYFVQLQTLDKDAVDSVMAVITSNNPVTMISGAMPNLKFEEFLSYFFYTGKNSQNIYINVDTENGVKTRYIYTLGMGKGNWDQNSRIRVWTNDANNPIKPEELSQAKAFFETTYYSIDKKIKQYPVFKVNEGKLTVSETIGYKEHIANHSKTAIHGKRIIGTNRMQFFVQPVIGIAIPEFDNNTVVEKKETVAPKKKPLEGVVRHKETIADPIVKPVVPTEDKKADIERRRQEEYVKIDASYEKHIKELEERKRENIESTGLAGDTRALDATKAMVYNAKQRVDKSLNKELDELDTVEDKKEDIEQALNYIFTSKYTGKADRKRQTTDIGEKIGKKIAIELSNKGLIKQNGNIFSNLEGQNLGDGWSVGKYFKNEYKEGFNKELAALEGKKEVKEPPKQEGDFDAINPFAATIKSVIAGDVGQLQSGVDLINVLGKTTPQALALKSVFVKYVKAGKPQGDFIKEVVNHLKNINALKGIDYNALNLANLKGLDAISKSKENVVTELLNTPDERFKEDMLKILSIVEDFDIEVVGGKSYGTMAIADSKNKKITVYANGATNTNRPLHQILGHEIVHLATVQALINPTNANELKFKQRLTEVYNKVKPKLKKQYATSNIKEFIAEFYTNEDFRNQLANIQENLVTKIWNWIIELFGFKSEQMIDVIKETNEITNDFIKNFKGYNKEGNVSETNALYDNYKAHGISMARREQLLSSASAIILDRIQHNISKSALEEHVKGVLAEAYDNTGDQEIETILYETITDEVFFKEVFNEAMEQVVKLDIGIDERENWQVESRYEINPYMSTSKQTRRFLATIPNVIEYQGKTPITLLNEFGLRTYLNPIGLHTNLADTLANKNVMEYLGFLGGNNDNNYIYDPVKKYIWEALVEFSKGDLEQQQIYQAFLTDFKKQKSTFVSMKRDEEYVWNGDTPVMIDKGNGEEQMTEHRFRIFQNNKMGQQNIIANWYNSFKFKMVRDEAIDTEKAKTLLTKYRKAREGQVDIPAIKEVLTEAGIDISIEALTLALSNPEQISKKYKADTFLDAIDTVLKSATKDGEGIVSLNNPFLNEETSLKLLARVEAQVNSTLFSSMFRNDEGKNIYAISNNTMLSYLDKDYQEKGIEFQHLTQDVYSKDSLLVKEIAEGIGYNIDIFSTATIEEASQFRGLSPNERTLVKITNFLNRGEDTARIQFPTIEAKPIVPILQVKRIRVDFDGKLDNNTLELAYNIVKSEFNRIKQVQEEQKTLEPKDLIMNYHYSLNKKGEVDFTLANGLKFHLIPEINDILDWKNIHAENLVDFKEEIKTWLNNHLNEKVKEEWDRLIELGMAYELNGQKKLKDEYKDKKSMTKLKLNDESLVRNYVINYFVRHADVYQVFGGDMAYSKGHVDMTKRLAMLIAPGLNLDTKEGTFKVAVIPDVKQGSAMIPNWDKVLDYLNDKYKLKIDKKATLENLKGINSTDAQSWLNLDAKKDWTHRLGRLSTEINQMIDNSSVGIHTAPKGQTIGSDKIVYAGRYWDGKKNITTYIKTSTNTIIPDAQNEDFQDLSKKADMITYPSAFKMGMRGMSEDASTPIELSYSGLMLQTEIPYHDETEITALSQARKMLMEGLLDPVYKNLDYKFYGRHGIKIRDFRRLFHNLHIANVKEAWADLSHKLGIKVTAEDGKVDYEITDLAKVRDLLLSSGKLNDVEKEMLELENGQFNIPLFFSTANERFESILFSIVSNKIIALEQNGSSFVQASQIGYQNLTKEREKVKLFKDLTKEQLDKIEFLDEAWKEDILNANKGSLRDLYYEDGKIKPAQILVSNIYRKYVKNGKADIEALRKEGLLNMFLMRAPYQLASGFPAEIVGFLPEEMGDVIVVPHEAMVRIGFDFDVDKLFGYFHNTDKTLTKVKYLAKPEDADLRWNLYKERVLKSKSTLKMLEEMGVDLSYLKQVEITTEVISEALKDVNADIQDVLEALTEEQGVYTEEEFKALPIEQQNSKKARENAILDMFFEVYEKPEIMYKLLTSNSEEPLKKATERIERKLNTSGPLTISEQERLFDANKDGKIGIAISSLWVTMQEDLQYNDVRINTHDGENEVINAGIKFLNSKGNIYKEINDDSKHFKELVLVEEKLKLKNVDTPQYEGVGFHKIKTRGISNDLVSKFMLVIQTSTVDNAKNQTMTPANLNAHTLSTVLYMSSMGIDDFDLMVRFINQPVIRDYVKLRNQNIKQYDVNKQLFTKYGALVVKNGGKPVKKEKDATKIKAYSSKELLTMLDKVETADYYNDQLEILNKWIIYSEGAGTIFGAAVSANLDTKKLGKNYFEALSRYHDYEKTIKQSTFIGLDKIFEGTLAGSFIDYAVKPSIKMFNNPQLLPYGYRLYIKANNFYLDNIGTFNEKTHRAFNSEMLAFVASFDNGISDVSEREELLKLPKQILALKTKYPENLLLKMIDVELGIEKRKRFDAIRFRRTNLEPEQVKYASQSFQELLDNPETAPYAEKMIKYTLLFYGLSQNSSSLLPVIPYRYLVAKGFGKAYKSKAFVEAMNSDDAFELFKDQYAANNVRLLQHGGTAIEGKSIILKASQAKAEYLSFRTKKGTFAGKAVATNHDATEFQYVLINPLGNEEFYEYSFKPVESVFSKVKFAPVQAVFTAKPVIEVKESVKEVVEPVKTVVTPIEESKFKPANKQQEEAVSKIKDFIDNGNPSEWFTLEGKAGTGKTTLIAGVLASYLEGDKFKKGFKSVLIGALSHKAKIVLKSKLEEEFGIGKFQSNSIAGMLGMKMDIETGKFTKDFEQSYEAPMIADADIIIIDEASMVNNESLKLIFSNKMPNAKVIFLGDIGQLPPIEENGNDDISPVFKTNNKASLTERIRQGEESPILPYADYFWNNSTGNNTIANPVPEGVEVDKVTSKGSLVFAKTHLEILPFIMKEFKEGVLNNNPNQVKIVTYRNATRKALNDKIRDYIFGEEAKNQLVNKELIIFMNNFKIDKYTTVSNSYETQINSIKTNKVDGWKTFLIGFDAETSASETNWEQNFVNVLDKTEQERFDKTLNSFKEKAMSYQRGSKEAKSAWRDFFLLKDKFAPIDYGYAITSHKSQGSTYNTTVIDVKDIMSVAPVSNKSKSRSIYTALTRPRFTAIVVNGKNETNLGNIEKALDLAKNPTTISKVETVENINGINISTKSDDILGRALTNPVWGSVKDGKKYYDVETIYKANASKIKAPKLNAEEALKYDMNLMYRLQVEKFKRHPELIDMINERGGLSFIESSSHIVGTKNSRWEGKGLESNFIKVLAQAYIKASEAKSKTVDNTTKQSILQSIEDLTIEESIKEELRQQLNNAQTEPELGEVIKRICNL